MPSSSWTASVIGRTSRAPARGPRIVAVALREQLQQVLPPAGRVACPDRGHDALRRESTEERRQAAARERGRHGGVVADRQRGWSRAYTQTHVDRRLSDVPAVDREHRRAAVAASRRENQVAERFEKLRRAVMRFADAVQVDVVAIDVVVDQCRRARRARQRRGERRRVEVVDLARVRQRQGRSGSRRPPCGATRTTGVVPGMTMGRTPGLVAFPRSDGLHEAHAPVPPRARPRARPRRPERRRPRPPARLSRRRRRARRPLRHARELPRGARRGASGTRRTRPPFAAPSPSCRRGRTRTTRRC